MAGEQPNGKAKMFLGTTESQKCKWVIHVSAYNNFLETYHLIKAAGQFLSHHLLICLELGKTYATARMFLGAPASYYRKLETPTSLIGYSLEPQHLKVADEKHLRQYSDTPWSPSITKKQMKNIYVTALIFLGAPASQRGR
ncbi:hypothetical protein SK128_018995 [Halocaridina rubra]|uniref:Uncharacterized protein n=1 Tax=Halocaridina rubra TaxID=373956 RepID=A0AAN9AA84_HALRR